MASKKQQRAAEYQQKMRDMDRKYKDLNLERPQDDNKQMMLRARQFNFKLHDVFSTNPNQQKILEFVPTENMHIPRMDFECYSPHSHEFNWINTEEELRMLCTSLKSCSEITIDLEGHNYHTLSSYVALIQIGTWRFGDFLIDPFVLSDSIPVLLKEVLESEDILKIGHDLTNDSKWLQQDFKIFMVGCIDTQLMWQEVYSKAGIGYKDACLTTFPHLQRWFKNETLSDWRLRPGKGMTEDQERYAVNDVHVLLRLFDFLRNEMYLKDKEGNWFRKVCEMSKAKLLPIAGTLSEPSSNQQDFRRIANAELQRLQGRKGFSQIKDKIQVMTQQQHEIFISLIEWRDLLSSILDEKPMFLVSTETILHLCCLVNPNIETIISTFGKIDKRIYNPEEQSKGMQPKLVLKIINTSGGYIEEVRKMECHNCLKTGHGPAWACPFPKNKTNYKAYFKSPKNREWNVKQNKRRLDNLRAKYGDEAARKAFPFLYDKNKN